MKQKSVYIEEGSINNAMMAITKRHIKSPFEINNNEWKTLQKVIPEMKRFIDTKEIPDGYNLGWNVETTGGQNVEHAHLHLTSFKNLYTQYSTNVLVLVLIQMLCAV